MATIVPISIGFVKNYTPGQPPPLYRGLALRQLPADPPLDHVGDGREVLPAPAFLHRLVVRPLGLLEHRRGHFETRARSRASPASLRMSSHMKVGENSPSKMRLARRSKYVPKAMPPPFRTTS